MRRCATPRRRSLRSDLHRISGQAGDLSARADAALHEIVRSDPALAIGAAAGLGFLLGGGVPRGAVTVLLGVGTRMAGSWLQDLVLETLQDKEQES
ncbi:MAG: hypothetical protein IPK00_24395 [Deltaproteobacteria bacterium]|nr:hypothetical protein [Deltaproteobacteria bacterium]